MIRASSSCLKVAACVCLFLQSSVAVSAGADRHPNLGVELSLSKSSIRSCEKIELSVTVTNTDEQMEVTLPAVMADPFYWLRIELVSPSGRRLQYEGPEFQIVGIDKTVTLFAGYHFGTDVNLTCDAYDFRKPGNYEVNVVYGYGPTDRKTLPTIVRSNTRTFTVSD